MSVKAPASDRKVECRICGRVRYRPPSHAKLLRTCGEEECVRAYANRPRGSWIDRFWKHVHKSEGCWTWTASTKRAGYGQFNIRKVNHSAHRLSYELAYGGIPDGLYVCHHCDNPRCVRPDHLFLGSAADNHADMCRKHRQPIGSAHVNSKLTEAAVDEIRRSELSAAELALRFGVSPAAVKLARMGTTWKHVA